MKTVALRFGENFAPSCGTIEAHRKVLQARGYVWYGKLGNAISQKVCEDILQQDDPFVLLIKSCGPERYLLHITNISRSIPEAEAIPEYYRDRADDFGCWLKVISIEDAPSNIMSKCRVISSGSILTEASRRSMSPVFIIDYPENGR